MSILYILLVLIVAGFVLYLVNAHIPMEPSIKRILNIVAIIFLIIWLLNVVGVWKYLAEIKI